MRNVLVVKTGATLPELKAQRGDYEDWISDGLGLRVEVVDVRAGETLPPPTSVAGIVVTGSSALVTDHEPWSEQTAAWLASAVAARTPLLGICYGHQLIAHGLGGEVGPNPRGREIGTIEVSLTEEAKQDRLFAGLEGKLTVSSSHRQSVCALPQNALRLAGNPHDANQAYAVGTHAWGVQFHPEWDHEVVATYLDDRRAILEEEGFDYAALRARVRPSLDGRTLLRRFAEIVRDP